ncbi:hypothetical protein QR509_26405, partial [Escherichia coli]|uniref:hypothetical protein n=1 Tax=Escherichia coli TaxID=562 RepID=UPI002767937A|nr:hypothetical protein [Escherichia coli]
LYGTGVIYDGTQFVATGAGQYNGGMFQTSTDGSNWTSKSAAPFEYFGSYIANGITFSNSKYIAVGQGETLAGGSLISIVNPS